MSVKGLEIDLKEFRDKYWDLFSEYHNKHFAWGSLHIILADGNLRESDIDFCIKWCIKENDWEGYVLAQILKLLSLTQLKKIYEERYV